MQKDTNAIYRWMIETLAGEGCEMFARFLEVESNHIEGVQFELTTTVTQAICSDLKSWT